MFFWIESPCGLLVAANVSEKRAVSIFRSEVINRDSEEPYTYIGSQVGRFEGKGNREESVRD
jgi:hypothetical protein